MIFFYLYWNDVYYDKEELWRILKGTNKNPGKHNDAVIKLLLAHGYSEVDNL